jgi:cell wall-associated NlpC family hydrolase
MITRGQIVYCAETLLGVTFRHQGRNPSVGLDCVGLAVTVAKMVGLDPYDTSSYSRRPDGSKFLEHFSRAGCKRKPILEAKPGDLIIFKESSYPCHVAILGYDDFMIHSFILRRKVVREKLAGIWLPKRVTCFEYPTVEEE